MESKIKSFLFVLSFFSIVCNLSAKLIEIDGIDTTIYGPEKTSIIAKSELRLPSLDGRKKGSEKEEREKIIFEKLVYQDAEKYNAIDEKLIDRYIEAIKSQHNLSLEELKKMFQESGRTYEEGREQLAIFNTVNQMLEFKVRSKVIIPEKDVKEYYDAHPVYIDESYKIQRIFVPIKDEATQESLKKDIINKTKIGEKIVDADYSEPFWVKLKEFAADKLFITKLKNGQSSKPIYYDGGFEVFTLLQKQDKKLVPFEKRYREIVDKLREPLFNELFEAYKESLFSSSTIKTR